MYGAPVGGFQVANPTGIPPPHAIQNLPVGRRRGVFIGINYTGQAGQLSGCHQDVRNVRNFINSRFPGMEQLVLTDERGVPAQQMPTRANITNALRWLVAGAQPGDRFFLHCKSSVTYYYNIGVFLDVNDSDH
jgi:hypothetical protein